MFESRKSFLTKTVATSVIALFFMAVACSKNAEAVVNASEDEKVAPEVGVNVNLNKALLLKLVNEKRIAGCDCGEVTMPAVAALTWNETLAQAALNHSRDMQKNNFFAHTSSNGNSLAARFEAVGYKWRAIAENIAKGQQNEQTVVAGWFNSEGHCKNLMSANYKETGAARVGVYWTQDFGAKRN